MTVWMIFGVAIMLTGLWLPPAKKDRKKGEDWIEYVLRTAYYRMITQPGISPGIALVVLLLLIIAAFCVVVFL